MNFVSPSFLFAFLPLLLVGYHLVSFLLPTGRPRSELLNVFLFGASVFFYAWGSELYGTWVLLASWAGNYLLAFLAARKPRLGAALAVMLNLALLGWFKYASFAVGLVPGLEHLAPSLPKADHLPLGVSFFTFQAISYVLDVARGGLPADRHPIRYGVYVFLFPHLIAGPIVRYADLAGQLRERTVGLERFAVGVRRFTLGLAKKLLLANLFAEVSDEVFTAAPRHLATSAAWLGVVCYALQIYFDFGGYSDMAVGLGKMFGFDFAENFNYPYSAASVTDFWRRWHISLSSWFRDYLYVPLGGNRGGSLATYRNLLVVFVLCGLWHGANWTFLVWGAWHGGFLVVERLGWGKVLAKLTAPLRHLYTLLAVLGGWVFFRATSLPHAGGIFAAMFGFTNGPLTAADLWRPRVGVCLAFGVLACVPLLPWLLRLRERWVNGLSGIWAAVAETVIAWVGGIAVGVLLVASLVSTVAATHSPFIYFRF